MTIKLSNERVLRLGYDSYMKINGDNLSAQLKRELPFICLITGDEPLLVGEASDQVRAAAREKGFTERQVFFVERGFDWNELRAATQAMSLFAEQRILELRLDGASPGNEGSEVLCDIAARPVSDILLMITTTKLDARSLSTKWVSAIDKQGVIVQVWPVELPQLPAWIDRRMQRAGLKPEPGTAALIAERVEGNLLAAQQEIDKLALLNPDGVVTTEAVTSNVADSARYDVLQLGLAAMQGQSSRALRILDGLREEGVDATLVLWGVNKDLQWMAQVGAAALKNQSVDSAMQVAGVWRPRQNAMKQALQRLRLVPLRALLFDAAQVDAAIKGVNRRDPWVELRGLVARMAGVKLARAKVA